MMNGKPTDCHGPRHAVGPERGSGSVLCVFDACFVLFYVCVWDVFGMSMACFSDGILGIRCTFGVLGMPGLLGMPGMLGMLGILGILGINNNKDGALVARGGPERALQAIRSRDAQGREKRRPKT